MVKTMLDNPHVLRKPKKLNNYSYEYRSLGYGLLTPENDYFAAPWDSGRLVWTNNFVDVSDEQGYA